MRKGYLILSSRKSNAVIDGLVYLIVVLILSLVIVIGYKILGDFNTEIQADAEFDTQAKEVSSTINTNYPIVFDAGFVLVVVLFWILVIVASFMIDAHPIFFAVSIFLLVFVLFVGGVFSNFYSEVIQDDDLGTAADSFPMTNWIMEHLLHLILVVIFSILIALYGKSSYGQ